MLKLLFFLPETELKGPEAEAEGGGGTRTRGRQKREERGGRKEERARLLWLVLLPQASLPSPFNGGGGGGGGGGQGRRRPLLHQCRDATWAFIKPVSRDLVFFQEEKPLVAQKNFCNKAKDSQNNWLFSNIVLFTVCGVGWGAQEMLPGKFFLLCRPVNPAAVPTRHARACRSECVCVRERERESVCYQLFSLPPLPLVLPCHSSHFSFAASQIDLVDLCD